MDPFAVYHIENAQQFWSELDDVLDCSSVSEHGNGSASGSGNGGAGGSGNGTAISGEKLANVLQAFITLTDSYFDKYLDSPYNQDHCIGRLFDSAVFGEKHKEAASMVVEITRRATSLHTLLIAYEIILQYGDSQPSVYRALQTQGRDMLPRLVHQIWAGHYAAQAELRLRQVHAAHGLPALMHTAPATAHSTVGWDGADFAEERKDEQGSGGEEGSNAARTRALQIQLRVKAVRLLYEVCRVQKLDAQDMRAFDERFIDHLFDLVEESRYHHDEAFNHQLIKLIVAMNEQFMVSGLGTHVKASGPSLSAPLNGARPINPVLDVLRARLNRAQTFGENLIFMLNRASSSDAEDLCMQLLVLKLLYLLFTTRETAHYFYTNDLKVLVDVFVRELSDLPDESESLRHTYLRVLHPLLTNTQLSTYPYKRPQIRRVLLGLLSHAHLRDISATTRRLVERCLKAEWCVELDNLDPASGLAAVAPIGSGASHPKEMGGETSIVRVPVMSSVPSEGARGATSAGVADEAKAAAITTSAASSPVSLAHISTTPIKTREKRVLSLSNPKSPSAVGEKGALRPTGEARRVASARSAPPTPPRRNSTSLSVESAGELGSGNGHISPSSSWHAHSSEHTPINPSSSSSAIATGNRATPQPFMHHPYLHHSSYDGLPRAGSPLITDSTSAFSTSSEDVDIATTSAPTSASAFLPPPSLPSVHVQEASGEVEEAYEDNLDRDAQAPSPSSSGSSSNARDRAGRRALTPSFSESTVRSRSPSPAPPPPPPQAQFSTLVPTSSAATMATTRRRPPPPPPNRATKSPRARGTPRSGTPDRGSGNGTGAGSGGENGNGNLDEPLTRNLNGLRVG